jgi:hypothetical protein
MLLKTILNRIEKHSSFVYTRSDFGRARLTYWRSRYDHVVALGRCARDVRVGDRCTTRWHSESFSSFRSGVLRCSCSTRSGA